MPHLITHDAGEHLINITYQGDLEPQMLGEIVSEVAGLAKQHDCFHILADFREAQLRFSTVDLYDAPGFLSQELSAFALSGYQFKRAMIAGKDWEDLSFFETVSANRGQDVKLVYSSSSRLGQSRTVPVNPGLPRSRGGGR